MMLARDVERLHAVLGLQDLVAVRVEQVVEELHVQLVVLDDQNRLRLRVHIQLLQHPRKWIGPCPQNSSRPGMASIKADVLTLH